MFDSIHTTTDWPKVCYRVKLIKIKSRQDRGKIASEAVIFKYEISKGV